MPEETRSYLALMANGKNETPHSWSLKISGATVFSSAGYITEEGARNSIEKVKKISQDRTKFIVFEDTFELHDIDGILLGKSIKYATLQELENAIRIFHALMHSSSIIKCDEEDENKSHVFTIYMSGEAHEWNKATISFQEAVIELFGSYDARPEISYTVGYKYKKTDGQYTSMTEGAVVDVKNKMRFEIDKTDRS